MFAFPFLLVFPPFASSLPSHHPISYLVHPVREHRLIVFIRYSISHLNPAKTSPTMKLALGTALGLLCSSVLVTAQTYTDCNPLKKSEPARFQTRPFRPNDLEANSLPQLALQTLPSEKPTRNTTLPPAHPPNLLPREPSPMTAPMEPPLQSPRKAMDL